MKKQQSNTLNPLSESDVPNKHNAIAMFEAQGGRLQRQWRVGSDLLSEDPVRQQRREHLFYENHSFETIFTSVVGGNTKPFKNGLKFFMRLTYSL